MTPEEIKEQKRKFSEMNFRQKAGYISYYYKWHIIIIAALVIFLGSFVHGMLTEKETVFHLTVINSNVTALDSPPLISDFSQKDGSFNPDKEEMSAEYLTMDLSYTDVTTMSTDQKLIAMIAAGSIDGMIAPEDVINKYVPMGAYRDLRELLTENELSGLEEKGFKIHYADYKESEGNSITHVPVGIYISDSPVIKSGFQSNSGEKIPYYESSPKSEPIYTVMINSSHADRAVDFIRYLTTSK
ncbi:MAG: hypothetical protein IJ805_05015 [Lachnospiraceae bacterium]|nr:hypothetical protein [Lachnospiraceae bacterium]